jgi:reactive intermediate/imine deaminase
MQKTFSNPPGVAAPGGLYSHVARLDVAGGTLLFVSGQVALDSEGRLVGRGDVAAQAEQVFANLKAILEANGASFRDVLKMNTYIVDATQLAAVRAVRARYFGDHRPASTAVGVTRLAQEEFLIEIEVVAALARRRARRPRPAATARSAVRRRRAGRARRRA